MDQANSPGQWETVPRTTNAREQRMAGREILKKMVEAEIAERPLSWWRRRSLVKFATHLGLDAYEAGLLIRSAEVGPGMEMMEAQRARSGGVDMSSEQVRPSWTLLSLLAPLLVMAAVYLVLSRVMAQ
jgi:hypothetical protein